MASLDQLKLTFFEECSEALQQIEAGLMDIRDGNSSDETVNAVFRGVHSVKGGAGIFGFEALVGFAHVFETVLDAVRSGKLAATPQATDVMLAAGDVLSDLVAMSRSGQAIEQGFGDSCRAELERLMGSVSGGNAEDDSSPAPAEFDGLDFTPVPINDMEADDGGFVPVPAGDFVPVAAGQTAADPDGTTSYAITFRPKADLLKKANEPLYILRELSALGELSLVAETADLPALSELEPDHPYIGWTGVLRTDASLEQIQEVFEFVVGDCELAIVPQLFAPVVSSEPQSEAAFTTESAPSMSSLPLPSQSTASLSMPSLSMPEPVAEPGNAFLRGTEPPAPARSGPAKPAATTTRVELEKIDRVVNMVGELVIAQAMLGQSVQELPEDLTVRLTQILDEVAHHTRELKDSVMSMRAQPVSSVFQRMPRLVRELSTKTSKKVRLEMSGENTEVDRSIVEQLGDPLTHIIRNSVDHGIETPADRAAAGKPEEGMIRLSASHRGGRIVIEVSDDGAGINSERVLKKARERGLVAPDITLSEDEINNLIFLPGFSTAETVSDISGRGVGMDVVRRNIQDIGGRITLKSERGKGMSIQLALPLTLAVMDGMVIKVCGEIYVMPMSAIVECLRPSRADIHNLPGTHGMLKLRGSLVPLVDLGDLLEISSADAGITNRVVMITEAGDESRFGVLVDELCGHQQVVIKSIEESYGSVPGISAATILGNGRVAFILDIEKLSELAATQVASPPLVPADSRPAAFALNR